MKKTRALLISSIWVGILSYLGFPNSWKEILYVATSIFLVLLSYGFYKDYKIGKIRNKENNFDNFLENKSFNNEQEDEIDLN